MIHHNKLIFNISKKINLKQEQINNTLKLIEQNIQSHLLQDIEKKLLVD